MKSKDKEDTVQGTVINADGDNKDKVRVAVIGAGIAGLTAAAKLVHNGIEDVVVLEAQSYVGGRCQAITLDGRPLDMGAMFIHGKEGNPIYEIAHRLGKLVEEEEVEEENKKDEHPAYKPNFFYTSKKEKIAYSEVEELVKCLDKAADGLGQGRETKSDVMRRYYREHLDNRQCQDKLKKELYDAVFEWYESYENVNEGTDTLDQVVQWSINSSHIFKGNHNTLMQGGFTTIINALEKLLPKGMVKTGAPATRIDWSEAHNEDGTIQVTCANGKTIRADHVIVTMSLGCVKDTHREVFHPALPDTFLNVIDNMELGTVGKVYLKWDEPVWKTKEWSKEFLWLSSHPLTLDSDKTRIKTRLGADWWRMTNFEKVSEHDNLLLAWFEKHQMDVIQQLDKNEVKAVLHQVLQHFLFDIHIPPPTDIFITSWSENPYTRGTYSYTSPTFDPKDVVYIEQPIPSTQNPRLLFAGEAFTLKYKSTTHGAFISGEQQADKVLDRYYYSTNSTDSMNNIDGRREHNMRIGVIDLIAPPPVDNICNELGNIIKDRDD